MRITCYIHLALTIFIAAAGLGCNRDKCKRVECVRGSCVEGDCVCPPGYEGSSCGSAVNEKFAGQFEAEETCTAGDDQYTVTILKKGGSPNEIGVVGLWEQTEDTAWVVIEDNGQLFEASRQSFAGNEITLTGEIDPDNIDILELTYNIYSSGTASPFDACTATLTRQ